MGKGLDKVSRILFVSRSGFWHDAERDCVLKWVKTRCHDVNMFSPDMADVLMKSIGCVNQQFRLQRSQSFLARHHEVPELLRSDRSWLILLESRGGALVPDRLFFGSRPCPFCCLDPCECLWWGYGSVFNQGSALSKIRNCSSFTRQAEFIFI